MLHCIIVYYIVLHVSLERFMHPNGQLPAYEWNFNDVNPPVHAWAVWRVFQMDRKNRGDAGDLGPKPRIARTSCFPLQKLLKREIRLRILGRALPQDDAKG